MRHQFVDEARRRRQRKAGLFCDDAKRNRDIVRIEDLEDANGTGEDRLAGRGSRHAATVTVADARRHRFQIGAGAEIAAGAGEHRDRCAGVGVAAPFVILTRWDDAPTAGS